MTHDFGTYVFRNLYHDFVNSSGKVKIGNNVYIGRDVTILKGVTVGDNCIIGLGLVVSKDIPSNSVAIGYPAKVVCSIEDYYKRRKRKNIEEAIEYAQILYKTSGKIPDITDFTEEWCLFLTNEEYLNNSEEKKIVDFRFKEYINEFFAKNKKPFINFSDFIKYSLNEKGNSDNNDS